ncbi:MAG: class I SAM-dependent methyltransferase [Pirellulales bacterium]
MQQPTPTFTRNWHNEPDAWAAHLRRLAGLPVRALEIGSYEGRSACWLLEHVLTHPDARLDCVDPFQYRGTDSESRREAQAFQNDDHMREVKERFLANVAPYGKHVRHWQFSSEQFFRHAVDRYQLIEIDGMHSALPTLRDMLSAWELLDAGGMMVIDDLGWVGDCGFESRGPLLAFNAFLACCPATDVRVLHQHYIGILEKLA